MRVALVALVAVLLSGPVALARSDALQRIHCAGITDGFGPDYGTAPWGLKPGNERWDKRVTSLVTEHPGMSRRNAERAYREGFTLGEAFRREVRLSTQNTSLLGGPNLVLRQRRLLTACPPPAPRGGGLKMQGDKMPGRPAR